jgi:hypothetical protein
VTRPTVACCFCGEPTNRGYQIDPFGKACPSCCDGFFSSRYRNPRPTKLTDADLARAVRIQLGPPYGNRRPLKIDVSDTGDGRTIETVGYGLPDRVGGRGLYVYRGPFYKRVYLKAKAPGDVERPRLNWHRDEYRKVVRKVAWIVWQETDGGRGKEAVVKGYWALSTQRARELARPYLTQNGERIGPPLAACSHYDPDFGLKSGPLELQELDELAKLPWGA